MPWQSHVGLAQKLCDRGYTTTSWTDEAPADFADMGLPPKSSGFSAAHYQPVKQSLSKQAQASLALFEREYRNEASVDANPAEVQTQEDPNAHLPFVFDDYAATRKSKLRVQLTPSVLQRALAHAELAETLVVSPITTDDKAADPIVIHPDVPDEQEEPSALELLTDASSVSVQADALSPEPIQDIAPAEEVMAEPEPEPEPQLPMVAGGISPEEVAQREAEQYAKGLAQAREEAAAELAEAVRVATEEAMAKGITQGQEEGFAQGREEGFAEGLAQGQQEGHAQGLEEGKAQGFAEGKDVGASESETKVREEVADEMAAQRVVFENAAHALHELIADPQKFFDPLKRLAMHIAEQVVLGELKTSSQAISRLVQRCLDELDHPVHGAVVLELNPQDKALLQAQDAELIKGMRLEAMHDMQRGSVRVFANDTVIEDLVAQRLSGLAKALLSDVEAWRDQSVLMKPEPVQADSSDVELGEAQSTPAQMTEQVTTENVTTEEVVEDDDVHS